ncbi:MAG: FAD binding domain-containing protein [Xanthomonadaceae bacterium]|nr:FAD binding domain-containing protein [Xanthomonadaceae bacterium]
MKSRDYVFFYLNGKPYEVRGSDVFLPLADYLRVRARLTGTKIVCAEGDCGACSVLRGTSGSSEALEPINSCIATVGILDGYHLITVDALVENETLSPIQKQMIECNGGQCGFCTPGFVVALTGLAEKKCKEGCKSLSVQDVKNALTGNLCRCTGYQPIIDAGVGIDLKSYSSISKRFITNESEKALHLSKKSPIELTANGRKWFSPTSVSEVSKLLKKYPGSRILSGGTDLGVQINKGKTLPEIVIDLHLVRELHEISIKKNRVRIGARVSLSTLRRKLETESKDFSSFLDIFASPQIKNMASIVGNLANASPIGDTLPFLLVSETTVFVASSGGKRSISIDKLWTGYRQLSLKKNEWITHIEFSIPGKSDFVKLYKSSQRKDLDISAVNAAFWVSMNSSKKSANTSRLAFGGVGATPIRALKTEKALNSQSLVDFNKQELLDTLQKDISPLSDLRGSSEFRRVLGHQFLRDYLDQVRKLQ